MDKNEQLEQLVKIAAVLDASGKTAEAASIDKVICKIAEEAKEEKEEKDEKGPKQLTGKAKAKLRTVLRACESLCNADCDFRGESKKTCQKIEGMCEDIVTACKELKLD